MFDCERWLTVVAINLTSDLHHYIKNPARRSINFMNLKNRNSNITLFQI